MNLRKVRSVAAFEWRGAVYQPSYWITFCFPLFAAVASGAMTLLFSDSIVRPDPTQAAEGFEANPMLARLLVAGAFVFPFFLAMFLNFSNLLLATVEERENRVGEVLLASMRADELIAGKLLGIGAAVMTQMGVWMLLVIWGITAIPLARAALPSTGVLVAASLLLVLGQFFLSSVFLAAACIGGSARASQQIVSNCLMLVMLPVALGMQVFVGTPHGALAHALSWFPLTAPLVLSMRMLLAPEGINWLEVVGVFGLILLATRWTVRLAARLYRMSLVSAGTRTNWRAALRQARLAPDVASRTPRPDVL